VHREEGALGSEAQVLVGQPLEPTTIDRPPYYQCGRRRPYLILLGRQAAKTCRGALAPEERGPAPAVTAALADNPLQSPDNDDQGYAPPIRACVRTTVVKPSDRQETSRCA
jgi:hypothetical protein